MTFAGENRNKAPHWQPHLIVDRERITGQNPFADEALLTRYGLLLAQ